MKAPRKVVAILPRKPAAYPQSAKADNPVARSRIGHPGYAEQAGQPIGLKFSGRTGNCDDLVEIDRAGARGSIEGIVDIVAAAIEERDNRFG